MFRYKKFLPYVLSLLIVCVIVLAKIPPLSDLNSRVVDSSALVLRIITFPLREIKKLLTYHSTYNRYLILAKETAALKAKLIKMEELEVQNARLNRLLAFKNHSPDTFLPAKVISRDPTNWSSSIIIDKGKNNGVEVNMCVVTEAGLVGKVIEAGSSTAKVMLINDPNSSVASLVQRSREQGITSGMLTGNCILHFLPAKSDIQIGDIIITSGLGGIYPKGFIIGQVTAVEQDPSGLYKNCLVKPQERLSSLEEVLVLMQ
ncbi:MAG: rod shape-determining protein MreC [Candidatus Omnitrophota bacterium]